MSRIQRLNMLREQYEQSRQPENREILKSRLSRLVERYGIEEVSAASGWAQSSILQYLRIKDPQINSVRLNKTREILEKA